MVSETSNITQNILIIAEASRLLHELDASKHPPCRWMGAVIAIGAFTDRGGHIESQVSHLHLNPCSYS